MRICEIANAEDQIALFKLITDKVWQSLGDQQRAEAEAKAAQPLKAKLKAATTKKPKPPAARPLPNLVTPKAQPARQPQALKQPQNIQAPSAKQKQNSNRDKESQSADFNEFDSQQVKTARGKDTHS
jgi:hypothetical protein